MIAVGVIRRAPEMGTNENVSPVQDCRPFDEPAAEVRVTVGQQTVERLTLGLPGVRMEEHRFAFYVERRGRRRPVAWEWLAAEYPGGPRLPQPEALVIRTATLEDRDRLIESAPGVFFVDLHYAGYPCVVARLSQISEADLGRALTSAWRTQALLRTSQSQPQRRAARSQLPLAV